MEIVKDVGGEKKVSRSKRIRGSLSLETFRLSGGDTFPRTQPAPVAPI